MKQNGHRKIKLNVAGLHLWSISFEYKGWLHSEHKSLTITTRNRSLSQATKKTERYLHRNRHDYPSGKIVRIEHEGIIDA